MHWGWAYDGVNASIPRNTGPECAHYLPIVRHIIESSIMVPGALYLAKHGMSKLPPLHINYHNTDRIVYGKQILLIMMTFLLGLEMGFKLCTRTAIYILNPCHITSMIQVYLLAAKPSKWTTTLFRIHVHYMNGPLLAFLFPEHDSRKITFELPTYYVQHGLMFVIPIYLLRKGGPYAAEKLTDFSYSLIAYGVFLSYHFGILAPLAVVAQVNLNHMICPAILDPFQGVNYRLAASTHQLLLMPIVAKTFAYLFSRAPETPELNDAKSNNECMITKGKQKIENGCDLIGSNSNSFGDVSTIPHQNDSNKKAQ